MFKKITLSCFCALAAIAGVEIGGAAAQFAPAPAGQQQAPQQQARPAGLDDIRLTLMIRNTIIALNQANLTGNYSVLRDMGTPTFQTTNSSARLGEVFSVLRGRKLDLSPIMIFNPKLLAPPSLQDGQVLRLTGFFPTTPEQVNFDLAFQLFGEQWMVAGIAVNAAPPTEGPQASAAPAGPARTTADASQPSAAKPGEAKPIRIDLGQPAPSAAQPPVKKPAAAAKKPKPHVQQTAAVQPAVPPAAPEQPAQAPAQTETPAQEEKPAPQTPAPSTGWNPFGR